MLIVTLEAGNPTHCERRVRDPNPQEAKGTDDKHIAFYPQPCRFYDKTMSPEDILARDEETPPEKYDECQQCQEHKASQTTPHNQVKNSKISCQDKGYRLIMLRGAMRII